MSTASSPEGTEVFQTGDYARAVVNILEDIGDERDRLETANKAVLNILEDADAEKDRLHETQRAVLNILEDLDVEKRRAENASRMKSEFLANMSHELRTPLNSIIGFAQLMLDGKVGPMADNHQEYLGDILSSGRHLLQLINDVLDLSKVEAGKMQFSAEPMDLAGLVAETRHTVRGLAAARSISIHTDVSADLAHIVGDAARLKQVLYNFLSNAIKFTDEGGDVTVVAEPDGEDYFRVTVTDTGQGIAPGDQARLFVEFQQLDASMRKRHQGTGLGLALTKRIVEAQGGAVGLSSELGVGSSFFAVLPRAPLDAPPEERTLPVVEISPPLGAKRVLVIEDDPTQLDWLLRTLRDAGYDPVGAKTGADAVQLARSERFDAITLDLVLPDTVGADVLRTIRQGTQNEDTPVVAVTGHPDQALAAFSVAEILSKPVDRTVLLRALQRLGVSPHGNGYVVVVDDDPSHRKFLTHHLKAGGYRTLGCAGGAEALAACRRDRPHAMVLDLLMPKMSGVEVLSRLKSDPALCDIPVIIWTSSDLTEAEAEHLLSGAAALMHKTGGADALLDALARILEES